MLTLTTLLANPPKRHDKPARERPGAGFLHRYGKGLREELFPGSIDARNVDGLAAAIVARLRPAHMRNVEHDADVAPDSPIAPPVVEHMDVLPLRGGIYVDDSFRVLGVSRATVDRVIGKLPVSQRPPSFGGPDRRRYWWADEATMRAWFTSALAQVSKPLKVAAMQSKATATKKPKTTQKKPRAAPVETEPFDFLDEIRRLTR